MISKSSKAFRAWLKRMGLTHSEAARNLDISITSVANFSVGHRCDSENPVVVRKAILLACAAIENGLPPVSES